MAVIKLIDKHTGQTLSAVGNEITLQRAEVVAITAGPADIGSINRLGNALVVKLQSGEVITVNDFFVLNDGVKSDLVFTDGSAQGELWWAEYEEPWEGASLVQIDNVEPLLVPDESWGLMPWLLLGGAGAGGVAAAASSGGGGSHHAAPDTLAPDAPSIKFNNKHGLTGLAEAKATVTLHRSDGSSVVTQADDKGLWHFNPNPMQEAEQGYVTASDAAGNESGRTPTGPADVTAPDAPIINLNNASGLSGSSEAGATITLTQADGRTTTTQADDQGQWAFQPNPLSQGENAKVDATDRAGNTGAAAETGLADITAPQPPVIDHNNESGLGGSGEPGGEIVVKLPDGSTVTTTIDDNGQWQIQPNPLDDGEQGNVTITDPNGNISPPTDTGKADLLAPDAPVIASNNGAGLTGSAEAGSTITLTRADGSSVTTQADAQGQWALQPNPLSHGSAGTVTATDASGNHSAPTPSGVADLLAPDAPVILTNNATSLSGLAEAGSTVSLTHSDGRVQSTQADANGRWQMQPNPLADNDSAEVTATDASGNISAPTPTGLADLLAPDTPLVDCNNLEGLSGTGEQGCTITLTRPDGSTLTAVVDANGNWLINPNPLQDSEEGSVNATDPSGNISSNNLTGQADLIPPAPAVIEYNNASGLGGTAEAGGLVIVTLDDGSTVTTRVDQLGLWEVHPNPLGHGENASITVMDPARNISAPSDSGLADLIAPDAPRIVSNNGQGLTGSGEPGSTLVLELADGSRISTLVDERGQWAFVPNPLADGERANVSLSDAAGNLSTVTDTGIADLIAPYAPLVNSNNLAGLSGTAEPGSTLSLLRGDGSSVTTQVDSNGVWQFKPNPLNHGEDAQVQACDRSGNPSALTATGNADLLAPDAPLIDSNNQLLLGGSAEAGATIVVRLPDGSTLTTTVDEHGRWALEPNPLNDGENARVTVTDPAGNISRPVNTGGSDIIAPDAPLVASNNGAGLTGSAEADSSITLTRADGSTLTTQTDGNGKWALQPNPLAHGEQGTLTASDASGNLSAQAPTGVADLLAPDAPVIDSNNHAGISGSGEAGATLVMQLPDGSTLTCVVDNNGRWLLQPNPLGEGEQAQASLVDPAGNSSASVSTGQADITAPQPPVIEQNNENGLGGSGEPGGNIVVKLPDGSTVTTTIDGNGNWAIQPNPLDEGEQGQVSITDPAGNTSEPSDTGKADLNAPAAPVVASNNIAGLAGTAEAGSTVSLLKGDGSSITTQVDSNGQWLFKPNPLSHGEAGQVSAIDPSGNVSAPTATGNADLIAPDRPVIEINNELTLGGSAEAGGSIVVKLPDGSTLTTTVDEHGQWAIAPNPLDDGESANVTVTDPAGNISRPVNTGGSDIIAPDAPLISSNNAAGLTGKAEPDSSITLHKPDGSTVTTQTDGAGRWALQPNPLADGEAGQVTATDASGNVSAQTPTGVADLLAPDAPVIDTNNDLSLGGSAEAGGIIVVKLPDGSTLTTVADDNGQWALRPNPLDNGETATVTVTDPAGNISAPTETGAADISAPQAPSVESNNLAGLTGTGEAGSSITLTKPDGSTVTTQADGNGHWALKPNPLANGEAGQVTATDASGNVSAQTPTGVADLLAPAAPVIDSNNAGGISGSAEAGGTLQMTLPDGSTLTTTVGQDGLWFIQPNPLANGEHASVTVTDLAGNSSAPSDTGSADISAPEGPIVASNNLSGLAGSAEAGSTITLTKNDGSTVTTLADTNGQWAMQPNPLANLEHGMVTATDPSGNQSTETATGAADLIAPDAPLIDSNNAASLGGSAEVGATILVKLPDGSTLITTGDEHGRWAIEPNPLGEGEQASVIQVDPAGNGSAATLTDKADVTAPDAPVIESNNEAGLTGSGEAGGTIVVELPDGSTLTTVVDDNGQWAIQPNPLGEGEKGSVSITDPAGNSSEPTETGQADVTPPTPPVVENNNGAGLDGSGEAGGTIVVELPDGSTLTTVVDDNGHWSIQPNPLDEGEQGTVTITDPSGNTSEPTETGKADLSAPDAPSVVSNNLGGLAGSAEAGSTITLHKPDGSTLSTQADAAGQWLFKPNPLSHAEEGQVTATDAHGNSSGQTPTGVADLLAPDKPVVEINNELTLGGSAEAGGTIVVKLPDGSTLTTTVDEHGQWAIAPNPLDDGESANVTVTDPAGNISRPVNTGGSDIIAPDAPTVASNNGAGITGKAEPDSTITLTKADGSTVTTQTDGSGNWALQPNPLGNGEVGKVTATDPSGNVSGETSTGAADLLAPDAPVIESNNEAGLAGSGEAGGTIVVELPNGSTVTTHVDGNGNWAIQPNPLGEGEQGKVTITDPAGNTSEPTNTGNADVIAPDAPVIESNNEAGLAGSGEAGGTIVVELPNGSTVTTTVDQNGQWALKPNPLGEGEQGKVTITDPAGNTSQPTNTGKADVIAPDAPIIESNNEAGLAGSGEAGGTIVVELPNGSTVTTTVDQNGQWALKPNPLGEGEQGKVTITDPAGNTSEPANTGKADLTAPDAPHVASNNLAGLSGTGEAGSTITLTKPDGSTLTTLADKSGHWAFKPNPLSHGDEGQVTASDASGNVSGPTLTGHADLVAPDKPVVDTNNELSLSGSAEAGGTIVVKLPDGSSLSTTVDEVGRWAITPNPLDDGESATVTVKDPAGNTSRPVNTGGSDIIAPAAPVVDSNNGAGLTGRAESDSIITLTKPDGSTVTTQTDGNGMWAMQPNPLANGEAGTVTATDPSGNVSAETATGVADLLAPDAPVIDSNNQAGLAGSGEAGGTIVVELPNGSTVTTTVDQDGQWAIQPNPLSEGEQGKVTVTDPAGNSSAPSNTGKADVTAPDAPVIESNNQAGLAGSGEAGGSIVVELPNGSTVTTTVDKDGHWALKPNPLADGEQGSVTVTDPAGNTSAPSNTGKADVTAPDAPVIESNNQAGLTGSAEAGGSIVVKLPNGSTLTTTVDEQGQWAIKPNPLDNGEKATVTVTDPAGNISAPSETDVTDISLPDAPTVATNNLAGLTGHGEANSTITLTKPGGSTVTTQADGSGKWAMQPNPLANGEEGKVTATDASGNSSAATLTGAADLLAPDAPVIESNNQAGLSGSAEAGGSIVVKLPNGSTLTTTVDEQGQWAIKPNPLDNGEKATVTVTDPAGNISAPSETDVTDISLPDAPTVATNNLAGLTGHGEANSTITLTKPDGSTVTTQADGSGKWALQPNPLANGEEGKVTATDASGNSSTPTLTGAADLLAPDAPVIESNNQAGLTGSAEAGGSIVVKLPNGSTLTTTVDQDGQWEIKPNPLDNGEKATVTVTDPAGNISAQSETDVTDISLPDAPTVATNNLAGLTGNGEANSTITLTKPDGSTVTTQADGSGKWAMQPNPLANGEEGKVTATDASGNSSAPTLTGAADLLAPDAPVIESNNQAGLTGSAEAGGSIVVKLPNGSTLTTTVDQDGQWAIQPNPLDNGEKATVTVTDPAGNISAPSETDVTDISLPDAPTVATNNLAGLTGSGEPNSTITLTKPDGSTVTTQADGSGKWALQPNPLANGEEGKVTATDASGNSSAPTLTGAADLVAPDAPVIESNNQAGLSGSAEAGGSIVVKLPNGSTLTTTVDEQGQWAIKPNPLDNGEKATVTVTDPAGNISAPSETDVTDITLPDAPTVATNNLAGLTGNGEANSTITLTKPDGSTVTTQADGSGKWALQPNPLANGEEGKVTATDASGNTSAPTLTGAADLVAPDAPEVDSNNAAGLTGTAEANSTIILTRADGSTVTTQTDANGHWALQPNPIPEGEQGLLSATDTSGNRGAETLTEVTDLTAPSVPSIDQVLDDQGDQTGAIANGAYTDDERPQLVGSGAEAGALIRLFDNGQQIGSTTADAQGNWSFTPVAALPLGEHVFTVSATDASGNPSDMSAPHGIHIMQPGEPLTIAITAISDDTGVAGDFITSDSSLTLSGTLSGELLKGERVQVSADGGNTWVYAKVIGSTWSMQDQTLHQGQFTYIARVVDLAGNHLGQAEQQVQVDVSAPEAKLRIDSISDDNGISDSDFITNDNTLLVRGSLDRALAADERVEVSVDGSHWVVAVLSGTSWVADLQGQPLVDGEHQLQARLIDTAANIGDSVSHVVQIDTVGPDAAGPDGAKLSTTNSLTRDTTHGLDVPFSDSVNKQNNDHITRDQTVTLQGTLSHALHPDEYLQISLDNGRTWSTLAAQGGTQWSHVLPEFSSSANLLYHLRVIDNAGNLASNTEFAADGYRVVVDLESPDKIVAAPELTQALNSNTVHTFDSERYGRVEAGALVSLVSDVNGNGTYQEGLDSVIGYVKANADGSWSLSTKLPGGAQNLAFVVWDEAGNRSGMSAITSVGVSEGDTAATIIQQSWGGTTDAETTGLNAAAVTINQDGSLAFFQSVRGVSYPYNIANAGRVYTANNLTDYTSAYLAEPTIANGAGANVSDPGYGRFVNSAVFADINRDGLADVMSVISSYGGGVTPYWLQNPDGTYQPMSYAYTGGVSNHMGGAIAYDRYGDGYLDFVLADSAADSLTFVRNDKGVLSPELAAGRLPGHPGGAAPVNFSFLHEVSAVDLNNDGRVDIAGHANYSGAAPVGDGGTGLAVMYNDGAEFSQYSNYTGVFRTEGGWDLGDVTIAMTWADFNGDGWLDLYLNRGLKNGANSNESRIYLNDGQGGLLATDKDALWFGDNVEGATSVAMDWNHDGKMDVIEVPRTGDYYSPITGKLDLTLYLNQGNNTWTGTGQVLGTYKPGEITGAAALDYDWDGAIDLILYRAGADAAVLNTDNAAPSLLVKNNNSVADGTSMHVRILDQSGLNVFYSNTVKLYNAKGELVSTQIINPQTSGTSNSMGLVSFYGLDANETYSVQLLRIENGVVNHVGAVAEQGGYSNTTINQNWGGLTTGKAHDAYVLTAENDTATNDTIGVGGIVGTGYNDTFFGSEGNDTFTGGAGWDHVVSGAARWSADGGMDVVDYSRAANAINANLHTGVAEGQGADKLVGIEGLIGSKQADTFTDNAANNVFEGRGGNDVFYLTHGGNDTLLYRLLDSVDGSGGNGHDSVYGFHLGDVTQDANADVIDLSDLLDYSGPLSFYKAEDGLTLDHSAKGILDYLNVAIRGNDTVISIDRDGTGEQSNFTEVVTLVDTHTDLLTLLQNNQIMV